MTSIRAIAVAAALLAFGSTMASAHAKYDKSYVVGVWRCDDFRGVGGSWLGSWTYSLMPDGTYTAFTSLFTGAVYPMSGPWYFFSPTVYLGGGSGGPEPLLEATPSGLFQLGTRSNCTRVPVNADLSAYGAPSFGAGPMSGAPYGGGSSHRNSGLDQVIERMHREQLDLCRRNRDSDHPNKWLALSCAGYD
jgi:hypothetical protein